MHEKTDDRQVQIAKLHAEGLSQRQISERLGIAQSTVCERLKLVKGAFPAPDGHYTKGTSTLYDADGNLKLQWVKTSLDQEAHIAAQKAAFEEMAKDLPRATPFDGPTLCDMDMLSAYAIGDAHFGMLAWGEETGAAWNLDIAESDLKRAMAYLVKTAPESKTGLIVNVGDFLHANGRKPVTPTSGAQLDVDTRFLKAVRAATRALRHLISLALQKHDTVKVINAPGNHDPDGAGWLSHLLAVKYEDDPRVVVDQHPGQYFYHQHGKTLIGVTHGDQCKFSDLPSIMAYDQPKLWGETSHRHFLTGHIHHTKQQEFRGVFCEAFNTLAAKDAWHTASGYRSEQQMQRIDFHSEHGEYSRFTCNVGMLHGGKNGPGTSS